MTVEIEMLPAHYGDSLLIRWGPGDELSHRMLIDGGLVKSAGPIIERVEEVGGVDLLVLTHVDRDHIGGVIELLERPDASGLVGEIWFNGYVHLVKASDLLGSVQGEKLTELVVGTGIPWNRRWPHEPTAGTGGPVVRIGLPPAMGLPGGATAILISPTPKKLADFEPEWKETVERAGLVPGGPQPEEDEDEDDAPSDMLGGSLDDIAGHKGGIDRTKPNGSSIAFVFEYEGIRVLLAGDAHAKVLVEGLGLLSDGVGPYRIDACKLPHHGSRGNVTMSFVESIDCDHWLVSTNGDSHKHPHDEALARIIVKNEATTFYANYKSTRWLKFTELHPPGDNGYAVVYPEAGQSGVRLRL